MKFSILILAALSFARVASALDYYELEVYPYETAQPGETEIENTSSVSSIFRSSMEFTHGISDRWELAAYADMSNTGNNDQLAYDATRFHARTHFFEKGELPLDFGAYAELEFHHRNDPAAVESEFRGIIEKDFGRFTVDVNPIIEQPLQGENSGPEFSYAASLAYRMDHTWRPHVDVFGDFASDQELLMGPALDMRLGRGFEVSVMAAVALTDTSTEKQLGGIRFEYEF